MDKSRGTHLITLGTAAGPAIRSVESGVSSAVVVDGKAYLVDFGLGATRRLHEAGVCGKDVVAGFVTHLHSDHVVDLPAMLLWNWGSQVDGFVQPVRLFGPAADQNCPGTSGFRGFIANSLSAYSYDIHTREVDEGRPALSELIVAEEVAVPSGSSVDVCEPFVIYADSRVRVSAVLTPHPPIFPAFAFRFDTDYGSITFSGDTARSETLVQLARGSDILVHEAVSLDYYRRSGFAEPFLRHQQESHTTPEDAGHVARAAGVRRLVLSHLAGVAEDRYWLAEASKGFDGEVCVAHSGDAFSLVSEHSVGTVR